MVEAASGKAVAAAEPGAAAAAVAAAAAAAEAGQQYNQAFHLSYCLVWLWNQLMQHLPHASESFRVLMSGAALPLAVLCTHPAAATAVLASPSSSSSGSLSRSAILSTAEVGQAVSAAQGMMQAQSVAASWQEQVGHRLPGDDLPPLALAWASSDVQQLQLAHLASVAELLHAESSSSSSSSSSGGQRQQQQAMSCPLWHQQLFASLGIPVEDERQQQQCETRSGRSIPATALAKEAVQLCAGVIGVATCHSAWILERQEQQHSEERQQRPEEAVSPQQQLLQQQYDDAEETPVASCGSNNDDSSGHGVDSCLSRQYAAAVLVLLELQQLLEADRAVVTEVMCLVPPFLQQCSVWLAEHLDMLLQLFSTVLHQVPLCLDRAFSKTGSSSITAGVQLAAVIAPEGFKAAAWEEFSVVVQQLERSGMFQRMLQQEVV
jgi:hypothetical protein